MHTEPPLKEGEERRVEEPTSKSSQAEPLSDALQAPLSDALQDPLLPKKDEPFELKRSHEWASENTSEFGTTSELTTAAEAKLTAKKLSGSFEAGSSIANNERGLAKTNSVSADASLDKDSLEASVGRSEKRVNNGATASESQKASMKLGEQTSATYTTASAEQAADGSGSSSERTRELVYEDGDLQYVRSDTDRTEDEGGSFREESTETELGTNGFKVVKAVEDGGKDSSTRNETSVGFQDGQFNLGAVGTDTNRVGDATNVKTNSASLNAGPDSIGYSRSNGDKTTNADKSSSGTTNTTDVSWGADGPNLSQGRMSETVDADGNKSVSGVSGSIGPNSAQGTVTANNVSITAGITPDSVNLGVGGEKGGASITASKDATALAANVKVNKKLAVSGSLTRIHKESAEQGHETVAGEHIYGGTESATNGVDASLTVSHGALSATVGGGMTDTVKRIDGLVVPQASRGWGDREWAAFNEAAVALASDPVKLRTLASMCDGQATFASFGEDASLRVSLSVLGLTAGANGTWSSANSRGYVKTADGGKGESTTSSGHSEGTNAKAFGLAKYTDTNIEERLETYGFKVTEPLTPDAEAAVDRFLATGLLPGAGMTASVFDFRMTMIEATEMELLALKKKMEAPEPEQEEPADVLGHLEAGIGAFISATTQSDADRIDELQQKMSDYVADYNEQMDFAVGDEPVPGIVYTKHVITDKTTHAYEQSGFLVDDYSTRSTESESVEDYQNDKDETHRKYHYKKDDYWSFAGSESVGATADTDRSSNAALKLTSKQDFRKSEHGDDLGLSGSNVPGDLVGEAGEHADRIGTTVTLDAATLDGVGKSLNREGAATLWREMVESATWFWTERIAGLFEMATIDWTEVLLGRGLIGEIMDMVVPSPSLQTLLNVPNPLHEHAPEYPAAKEFISDFDGATERLALALEGPMLLDQEMASTIAGIRSPDEFSAHPEAVQMAFIASVSVSAEFLGTNAFDAYAAVSLIRDDDVRAKTYVQVAKLAKTAMEARPYWELPSEDLATEWQSFVERRLGQEGDALREKTTSVDVTSDELDALRAIKESNVLAKYLLDPILPGQPGFKYFSSPAEQVLHVLRAAEYNGWVDNIIQISGASTMDIADLVAGKGSFHEKWILKILAMSCLADEVALLAKPDLSGFLSTEARATAWETEDDGLKLTAEGRSLRAAFSRSLMGFNVALGFTRLGGGAERVASRLEAAEITASEIAKAFDGDLLMYAQLMSSAALAGVPMAAKVKRAMGVRMAKGIQTAMAEEDVDGLLTAFEAANDFGVLKEAANRTPSLGGQAARTMLEYNTKESDLRSKYQELSGWLARAGKGGGFESLVAVLRELIERELEHMGERGAKRWVDRAEFWGIDPAVVCRGLMQVPRPQEENADNDDQGWGDPFGMVK